MSGRRRMLIKQRQHDAEMAAKQAELDAAKAAQAEAEARAAAAEKAQVEAESKAAAPKKAPAKKRTTRAKKTAPKE